MSSKDLVPELTTTSASRSGPPSLLLVFVPGCAHPSPSVRRATVITVGDLTIDPVAHLVQLGGGEISLTPLEYSLLVTMAQYPNRVFSRETLLREVWGYTNITDTRLVNVHVQRLRSKVERNADHPQMIVTVRGIGYRINTPGEES